MLEAILIDLDGTLLNIDMNVFIPHYLAAMQKMAVQEKIVEPDHDLTKDVLYCTSKMLADDNPLTTNEDVFMEHFFRNPYYSDRRQVIQFFNDYYDQIFPTLADYTAAFAHTSDLMQALTSFRVPIVLATNPVFPYIAIRHRCKWAGVQETDFTLMTSYDNMHFCKPKLSYYEEICTRINVDPKHCIMIGNDSFEDMNASKLGMQTFLLTNCLIPSKENQEQLNPTWQGSMEEFIAAIPTLLGA